MFFSWLLVFDSFNGIPVCSLEYLKAYILLDK